MNIGADEMFGGTLVDELVAIVAAVEESVVQCWDCSDGALVEAAAAAS